jgi:hypothetical protein
MKLDDFIGDWNKRAASLSGDAIGVLAQCDECPVADGVLGDWVRKLERLPLSSEHTAPIVALIGKGDPLLQEAGIVLASQLIDCVPDAAPAIETAIAKALAEHPIDPWILEAVAGLLRRHAGPSDACFAAVYRELAGEMLRPSERFPRPGIMRNRAIHPHHELVSLFEQHYLQRLTPTERERAILPVLEKKHGTVGFEATQRKILESMGFDVAEHLALLRR